MIIYNSPMTTPLEQENREILEKCKRIAAQFYSHNDKDITQDILNSPDTTPDIKNLIQTTQRRFFLFCYPSDGHQVKGYISFVPDASSNPLLIYLRGGNKIFGLSHPATPITCMRNYTVLATAYRGGVSEGTDDYGGEEVNDVPNLLNHLPKLQQQLGLSFHPQHTYMLGGSRGGMEMFLALARFPKLSLHITKAVSLSGLLDMEQTLRHRPDMKEMFIKEFHLDPSNPQPWIQPRNPLNAVSRIRSDLPFLILQGTEDIRVSLQEGTTMLEKLRRHGNPTTYLEVPGGDHCLRNQPRAADLIADWLEC